MSAIVRDELVKPMEKAVWNIEHVLKFPNSKHLRYHWHDMSWIDYSAPFLCLTICFACLLSIFLACICVLYIGINNFIKTKWIDKKQKKM